MDQITTITFFRYATFSDQLWGFSRMQYAHKDLRLVKGQSFYKLMGSGREKGFNPRPDWSVYSLLQVWESEEDARQFFDRASLMQKWRARTTEIWTLYMKNITTKGQWSGRPPFRPANEVDHENNYLAVITRATVKWQYLMKFWQHVPASHKALDENPGLIYTKGIGDVPILQMATFSVWKNAEALQAFAYQSQGHKKAIQKTRELNWFKEDLFSRFQPYLSVGTWGGKQLLPELSLR